MKTTYKLTFSLLLIAVAFAALYGLREWRLNQAEEAVQDPVMQNGLLEESLTKDGVAYLVPPSRIYDSGYEPVDIPALSDPAFESILAIDEVLADNVHGVVVEVDGEARFYSYQILNWHLVVNDDFNGQKLAITFCPLCRSAQVFERNFDNQEIELSASGQVYNNNFLLSDNSSNSLWYQIRGLAVSGDRAGEYLSAYPSEVMTWLQFKERYPQGEALSTETGLIRDYTRHPYGAYDDAEIIYFPLTFKTELGDPKWLVNTVSMNGEHLAFADIIMKGFIVHNETVGNEEIVGLFDTATNETRVFSRVVNDQTLTFTFDFDANEVRDEETNSIWNAYGQAIDGELEGEQLQRLATPESFWFCAYAAYQDVALAKVDAEGDVE